MTFTNWSLILYLWMLVKLESGVILGNDGNLDVFFICFTC